MNTITVMKPVSKVSRPASVRSTQREDQYVTRVDLELLLFTNFDSLVNPLLLSGGGSLLVK